MCHHRVASEFGFVSKIQECLCGSDLDRLKYRRALQLQPDDLH